MLFTMLHRTLAERVMQVLTGFVAWHVLVSHGLKSADESLDTAETEGIDEKNRVVFSSWCQVAHLSDAERFVSVTGYHVYDTPT